MGQLLRITFEGKDYTFKLLNQLPLTNGMITLDILFDDTFYRLTKKEGEWFFEDVADVRLLALSKAIGKSISLRYRI